MKPRFPLLPLWLALLLAVPVTLLAQAQAKAPTSSALAQRSTIIVHMRQLDRATKGSTLSRLIS